MPSASRPTTRAVEEAGSPGPTARIVTLTFNPALDCSTAVDLIRPTTKLHCDEPRYDPGGGGINVARVLHALGNDALALFPAGGATGEMLADLLTEGGTRFVRIPIGKPTRESFCVTERATGDQFRFVLPGPELSDAAQRACLDRLAALQPFPPLVVASGSLPAGVRPDLLWQVGDICRAHGARMILDTSGEALRHAARCRAFLIKPNEEELQDLVGHPLGSDAEIELAARRRLDSGFAENLLVSLGARGALLVTQDGVERLPAIDVPLQTTVGAGDSMVAGVVLGLARGWPIAAAARLGMAAGTAALLRPGTELARRGDVQRLYRQVCQREAVGHRAGRRSFAALEGHSPAQS